MYIFTKALYILVGSACCMALANRFISDLFWKVCSWKRAQQCGLVPFVTVPQDK